MLAAKDGGQDASAVFGAPRGHGSRSVFHPFFSFQAAPSGRALQRFGPSPARRDHFDAVNGAGRRAERAADAPALHHRVHQPLRADDRVDETGLDAPGAADAAVLLDQRDCLSSHDPRLQCLPSKIRSHACSARCSSTRAKRSPWRFSPVIERALNAFWILLGAAAAANAWTLGLIGPSGPESGLFPLLAALIVMASGIALLFSSPVEPQLPRGAALLRVVGVVGGLAFMALALPFAGFAVTGALTMLILVRTAGDSSWMGSIVLAL